jgi:hypothetical protein
MLLYIYIRGRWCVTVVRNVQAMNEYRNDDKKDSLYEELERVLDQLPKCHMKVLL